MKSSLKDNCFIDKIIKIIFLILMVLGLSFTLIYIFYTATGLLTSDSVITDVLAHQQIINKELILSNWYYGNEFWLFSLTIPTVLLSFIIKNNILLRQVSVFITAIIFFVILYKYGRKFLGKRETFITLIIFMTGISYSVLDYFYAFNAYLTVIINSMLLLYFYYKSIETNSNKKKYYVLALIFTFLFNMSSLRYVPSVTAPFILTELILIVLDNKNSSIKTTVVKEEKKLKRLVGVSIFCIIALSTFTVLTNAYYYEQRAGATKMTTLSGKVVTRDLVAVSECISNFFGYDNQNNPVVFMTGSQYFVNNHRDYPKLSFFTFTNIIKIIICLIVIIITPIMLYKNYNKNDKKINFLLIFNTLSWSIMIYMYVFTSRFMYNNSELKYFIFNMVLSMILSIYYLYNYVSTNHKKRCLVDSLIILYIISNIYTTILTIRDYNKDVMQEKFELAELLEKNNLTFGYGTFWNSLLTNYLSNYKVTVASVELYDVVTPYRWYSDKRWYDTKEHRGRVFLILDRVNLKRFDAYKNKYPEPDNILKCKNFTVYVYNKNPFLDDIN